jgi:hypothetical protein
VNAAVLKVASSMARVALVMAAFPLFAGSTPAQDRKER